MRMACDGFTHKEIAQRVGTAHSTVRTQAHTAMRKLGATNTAQAAVVMMRQGWHHHARREPDAPPLPPWLRLYLHEFDRHLAGDPKARQRMTLALAGHGVKRADPEPDLIPPRLMSLAERLTALGPTQQEDPPCS